MSKKEFFPTLSMQRHPNTALNSPSAAAPGVHAAMLNHGADKLKGGRNYTNTFALSEIKLNPSNPRLREIQRAGVSSVTVSALKRKAGETIGAWQDRFDQSLPVSAQADVEFWQKLFTLAVSIDKVGGLIEPMVINPDNQLIAGERRYWALQLLGLDSGSIVRKLFEGDAEPLSPIYENTQRSDLPLDCLVPSCLEALESIYEVDEWDAATRKRVLTLRTMMQTLSLPKTTAYKMLEVCRAWTKNHPVKEMILTGKVKSLTAACNICKKKENEEISHGSTTAEKRPRIAVPPIPSDRAAENILRFFGENIPQLRQLCADALDRSGHSQFETDCRAALRHIFDFFDPPEDGQPQSGTENQATAAETG